jgi:hypothetical protein
MSFCGVFLPSRIHRKGFLPAGPQVNARIIIRIKETHTFFRPCARAKPVEPVTDKQLIIDTVITGVFSVRFTCANNEDLHGILQPQASCVKRG